MSVREKFVCQKNPRSLCVRVCILCVNTLPGKWALFTRWTGLICATDYFRKHGREQSAWHVRAGEVCVSEGSHGCDGWPPLEAGVAGVEPLLHPPGRRRSLSSVRGAGDGLLGHLPTQTPSSQDGQAGRSAAAAFSLAAGRPRVPSGSAGDRGRGRVKGCEKRCGGVVKPCMM